MKHAKSIISYLLIVFSISLLFVSCSGDGAERVSLIKSAKYDSATKEIKIEATFDSSDVREFRGETIYLMEITPERSISDVSTLIPIAKAKSGGKMSFSAPLYDGARTRLYSSFTLACFSHEKGYVALCDEVFLENPEALAKNKSEYPVYPSQKGLYIVSSSDAVLLGVKHTVIRMPIEDYILSESTEGSVSYIFDGTPYYFNGKKIEELDYKIKNLNGAGIEIILEFTLDTPPSVLSEKLKCLALAPEIDGAQKEDGKHYAINASGGDSYRYLAAFFEMISERYTRTDAKYGFAASYILGHGVNSLSDTNIDINKTLSDSLGNYKKLLRIASTALCSKYANGKIYASLNGVWEINDAQGTENELDPSAPVAQRSSFGAKEFISALLSDKDFATHVGIALIPEWQEKEGYMIPSQFPKLRALIGDETPLLLYDFAIPSSECENMSAIYAYAYLEAFAANADAFIYNGHLDGATGNPDSGLFTSSTDGAADRKRAIYDTFADIDKKGAELPLGASAIYGERWNYLVSKYSKQIATAKVSDSPASTVKSKDKKIKKATTATLFDFSGGDNFSFFPSDSAAYVELSDFIGTKALKSGLYPKYKGENMGVRSAPIPFSQLKNVLQITTVMMCKSLEGNTARVTLALVQSNENGSAIHTSTATIQTSNRQKVYFDTQGSALNEKLGDVTLYLWMESSSSRSPYYSGEEAEEMSMYIESISVSTEKRGSGAVFITILIILAIVIIGVLFLMYLREKSRQAMRRRPPQYRNNGQRPLNARPPYGARPMQSQRPVARPIQPRTNNQNRTTQRFGDDQWKHNMR